MADPTEILVANLSEALKLATGYLTVGLATAVSAYAIDRRTAGSDTGDVTVPGVPIAVAPGTAKALLLGLCWVAGGMASYAMDAAALVVGQLQRQPDVLAAACTYPSLATAPVGYGLSAALLPVAFAWRALWPVHRALREQQPRESTAVLFLFFLVPYGAAALGMRNIGCP